MTAAATRPPAHLGVPAPRRYLAIFAVSLAVTMAVMDGAMVNIALPEIARDLGETPSRALWVVNAYQLAAVIALMPLGKLADVVGHKRVYLASMGVFVLGSIGCAVADTLATLAIARLLQGVGAAGLMSCSTPMLRLIYPSDSLGRGIGFNGFIVAMALVSGPTIASGILALGSWHWLFLVNVPVGALLLLVGAYGLPGDTSTSARFDPASAALSAFAFGAVMLGVNAAAHGLSPLLVAASLLAGAAAGVALVARERLSPSPLLPIDLLRTRIFALSVGVMFSAAMAQTMAYVALPFLLQYVLGRTQVESGLLFTPWPLAVAVAAPIAGLLCNRISSGILCGVGLSMFATALILLAALPPGADTIDIVWRMALCGFGYGLFQPPNSRALIISVPMERAGNAGGMSATARVLGQAIGAALVALLFRVLGQHGMAAALYCSAAVALAAALVSIVRANGPRALAAARG